MTNEQFHRLLEDRKNEYEEEVRESRERATEPDVLKPSNYELIESVKKLWTTGEGAILLLLSQLLIHNNSDFFNLELVL